MKRKILFICLFYRKDEKMDWNFVDRENGQNFLMVTLDAFGYREAQEMVPLFFSSLWNIFPVKYNCGGVENRVKKHK